MVRSWNDSYNAINKKDSIANSLPSFEQEDNVPQSFQESFQRAQEQPQEEIYPEENLPQYGARTAARTAVKG
jgi:hypothetical protein